MCIEIIIYAILLISLFCVCDNNYSRKYYVPIKVACSASFLVFYLINTVKESIEICLLLALIFCFIGDLIMGLYQVTDRKKYLILGMAIFLLGHIGLLGYMYEIDKSWTNIIFIFPSVFCILLFMFEKKFGKISNEIVIPEVVYAFFVSAMLIKSLSIGAIDSDYHYICVSGILFFISDLILTFVNRYSFKKQIHKKLVHIISLGSYYIAILMFVILG